MCLKQKFEKMSLFWGDAFSEPYSQKKNNKLMKKYLQKKCYWMCCFPVSWGRVCLCVAMEKKGGEYLVSWSCVCGGGGRHYANRPRIADLEKEGG